MEKIELKGAKREVKNGRNNKLRKAGLIPAVLYGHHTPSTPISINANDFFKVMRKAGESTIIDLVTEDSKTHPVLIHEVQYDAVKSHPLHVDFYEVNMTEKLKASVTLEFIGESNAVKAMGGVLVKVLNEVEVECLPADLPHNIEVDITPLQTLDDVIYVKDLKVSPKVKVETDGEEIVVKVQPPRDVEAELAQPVEENVAEVVAASTEKPAEEQEEAEGEAKKA